MDDINTHVEITDKLMQELVDSGNFKQALKHADKRMKKTPTDAKLLISRASIYLQSGELEQCVKVCKDLTATNPPIVQLEILRNLFFILTSLQARGAAGVAQQDVTKPWLQAIQRQTLAKSRLDMALKWVEAVVKYNRWDHLDPAAGAVQQHTDPKDEAGLRKAYFLRVLGTALSLQPLAAAQAKEQVLARLAVMRLVQAAKLTERLSKSDKAPGVRIASTKELNLAIGVFQQWNQDAETRQVLAQDSTGPFSTLAANQPTFIRVLVETLRKSGSHEELVNVLRQSLSGERPGLEVLLDDYLLWDALVDCEREVKSSEITAQTESLLNQATGEKKNRAPRKARLSFLRAQVGEEGDKQAAASNLIKACVEHFKLFASSGFVTNDLVPIVLGFSKGDFDEFRGQTAALVDASRPPESSAEPAENLRHISASINTLKVDFERMAKTSADDIPESTLTTFVCTCLRLYQSSLKHALSLPSTDTNPGDEACVLAVRALRTLWLITSNQAYLVQSAMLLEFLLANSKHNYKARVMLVSLLQHLGLHSLAAKAYFGLRVKGIVCETICPSLFTRLATICPQLPDQGQVTKHLQTALDFYDQAVDRVPEFQVLAVEEENYAQVLEFNQLRSALHHSLTREMLVFHCRRVGRLGAPVTAGTFLNIGGFRLGLPWRSAADLDCKHISNDVAEQLYARMRVATNELSAFHPRITEPFVASGPTFGVEHVQWLRVSDLALSMVSYPAMATSENAATVTEICKNVVTESKTSTLTHAEQQMLSRLSTISNIAVAVNGSQPAALSELRRFLNNLREVVSELSESWQGDSTHIESTDASSFPGWEAHQHMILSLEAAQAYHKLAGRFLTCVKTSKGSKADKDGCTTEANQVMDETNKVVAKIQDMARTLQRRLDAASKANDLTSRFLGDSTSPPDERDGSQGDQGSVSWQTTGHSIRQLFGKGTDEGKKQEDGVARDGESAAKQMLQTMLESAKHSLKNVTQIKLA